MLSETPHSRLLYVTENIAKIEKKERIIGSFLYDGKKELVARIDGLLLDRDTSKPVFLVISFGGFLKIEGKKALVPRSACEPDDIGKVNTDLCAESLQDSPIPNDIRNVTPDEERLILGYFDL